MVAQRKPSMDSPPGPLIEGYLSNGSYLMVDVDRSIAVVVHKDSVKGCDVIPAKIEPEQCNVISKKK